MKLEGNNDAVDNIKAIYTEGKLVEAATCKDYLQVRTESKRQVSRNLRHYSLPAKPTTTSLTKLMHSPTNGRPNKKGNNSLSGPKSDPDGT